MPDYVIEIRDADGTRRVELRDRECIRLGRSRQNDVKVEAAGVSRNHALVVKNGDGWKLVDLKSSNATFLRGQPVRESDLKPGDEIRLGSAFLYFLEASAASPAPTPQPRASAAPRVKEKGAAKKPAPPAPGIIQPGLE